MRNSGTKQRLPSRTLSDDREILGRFFKSAFPLADGGSFAAVPGRTNRSETMDDVVRVLGIEPSD